MTGTRAKGGLFLLMAAGCLWPRVTPALALASGTAFSLLWGNPLPRWSSAWSKRLLQIAVIGLGFGVGLPQVLREGAQSLVYTVPAIALALGAGWWLGRRLRVEGNTAHLISFGTAICGGSAIAALAPALKAGNEETAVSLATVFTLNAAALLLFPVFGRLLEMDQPAFGLWAALAIHDTSSVVGAAAAFGDEALRTATIVKLTRTLWIAPCVLAFAWLRHSGRRVAVPLFIVGFLAAALASSALPGQAGLWAALARGARRLLTATLFFIGAGLTREVLRRVGLKPLLHGVALWALMALATLAAIVSGLIP